MKPVLACLFCLALGASAIAAADELSDADALFAKKAFPEALQKYTRLANAGNVMAQQHLGEMYFYGDAGSVDMDKAALWWGKAAAKGNKVAIASLDMMKKRSARRADIDYWVTQYDGSDLVSGEYHCPAPRFPAVSKVNDEIQYYSAKMKTWEACHNALVKHLNASLPLTTLIPKDLALIMTKDETEKAAAHLKTVGQGLADDTQIAGKMTLADYDAWRSSTEAYVKEHNEILKNAPKPDVDAK
ncbi:MAG TPA: sel1 repeat family protein [Telluria sp.]